ncbi:MAG: acyl carrier protein [Myxococcales bacterium]|nr:acyl carrier protein [Myxococcales bacterium]
MERENIDQVVRKYLARALDLDPATIDASRSMKDLGANSLDIVEVVSSSMRELRVKIPREELSEIRNIEGLVDALHAKAP